MGMMLAARTGWRRLASSTVARQLSALTAGRAVAALFAAAWLVVAARMLTIRAFGDLALLLGLGAVFSVMGDLGLPLLLNAAVARKPCCAAGALRQVIWRRLAAGSAASALVGVLYMLAASERAVVIPLIFSVSLLSTTVYTSCTASLRAIGSVAPDGLNEALSRAGVLVAGWVTVAWGGGLLGAVAVYSGADLLSAIALYATCLKRLPTDGVPVRSGTFSLRRAAPLAMASFAGIVYYRIDVWLLALMRGAPSVAVYAAGYRVLDGVLLPASAMAAIAVTHTAAAVGVNRARVTRRLAFSTLALTIPAAAVAFVLAPVLLGVLFGPAYAAGASTLQILLASTPLGTVAFVLAPIVAVAHRKRFAGCVTVALIVNVAGNIALIPSLGTVGAALMTLVGQALLASLLCWSALEKGSPNLEAVAGYA
jgi:stage V sporulation protein B